MSRPSFRARPLDLNQKLNIVRDPKEISADDIAAQRAVQHSHVALDKENDQVQTIQNKGGSHEIPIPDINIVETYVQDVKPNFVVPDSYVRFIGQQTYGESYLTYDLDTEDGNWLNWYNAGQNRLPAEKFENMLQSLEVSCSQAMEKQFQVDAANAAERGVVISFAERTRMVASTSALDREAALEALRPINARTAVHEAVYDYWMEKRARRNRPLMRVYMMPPPVTDTNPYNVFRPREKISRPQTRRKRENDAAAFEKMQEIRRNLDNGLHLLEMVHKRERRKRDMVAVELDLQTIQTRMRHDARAFDGGEEAPVERQGVGRPAKARASATAHSVLAQSHWGQRKSGSESKKSKKARRQAALNRKIPACPPPPCPQMLFAMPVNLDAAGKAAPPPAAAPAEAAGDSTAAAVAAAAAAAVAVTGAAAAVVVPLELRTAGRGLARFGRGGRLVFDRCNVLAGMGWEDLDMNGWVQ